MTKVNHNKHIELIQSELIYQKNEFEKLLKKQAAKLFVENQLYLCRYQGFDEARGNLIVKFDHKICNPPRKNENLQCFVSEMQNDDVKNWGGISYQNIRSKFTAQFESKTVFFTFENGHTIVGLSGVKIEDVPKYQKDTLVFLAPTDPPLEYLFNLQNFLKETQPSTNEILDLEIGTLNWNPQPLTVDESIVTQIQTDLIEKEIIIIQGPPGTGKTFLMAQLCSAFLKTDYRILVTALTNRALIELAEKEHLKTALSEGKIYKSTLTADESKNKKIKGIKAFKSLSQQQPQMLLATYYIMSQIAAKAIQDTHFDYIIIEEASQAFLSTIALARKLGKKCIIIGDIKQLEPIFHKEYAPEDTNNYHWMICGLKAISFFLPTSKQYILTDSYRLPQNSVDVTNSFYSGQLKSKSSAELPLNLSNFPLLNESFQSSGGTSIRKFQLADGKIPSTECSQFIIDLVNQLKQFDIKSEIAVLAFYRDSVRFLQKEIYSKCADTENVLVETIDRIQGLTTDFTIFFIPTESIPFALQANRFNVATSRAKLCTLIITDKNINSFYPHIYNDVKTYLQKIKEVFSSNQYSATTQNNNNIEQESENKTGLKVLGKIDLSKFEKPKKEINKDKKNIYIIDTNVFVDQPDIISKIDQKYSIVLSAKVIDELDYLKISLAEEQKKNVQRALRLINESIEKRNIKMDTADLTLLPNDFNKKSPDNFILSVAIKYKDENPIMLTSDNGLQIKAKGLYITTITLNEFLKQLKY
ncbi:MAG: AAA family ATPase [Saprospiraceae bacterium]|jgi:DNA replication ATP-dependent helicase Dna2|uniref:PIN domain-containing protein n=1 Tax=Candidatus Brachybacter algidus TaxID=2982024 RepID=UPI001B46ECD1|nr:PIN domain-containing protein [Candidatus Brachybacter algidus]MBP7304661.1 AAA family ATPase [Saprospiraceae bacterium]MBK7603569.1 AAA family ATPase [Candidatus Brachybacter algidus]MBK8356980.1 AAA family ATPase [Candidatus Brachybacter algidus]MBK9551431.1 AAA family ATPase [Candidatus Brachybacter algidus]MBL0119258.1 AAA family ATPase [Candidatus Brachybacter algidus]